MPELMVKLDDGTSIELKKCDWVFRLACGCPFGVMSTHIKGAVYDEDTAFYEFFYTGRKGTTQTKVKRERERGVTAELITHERYRAEILPAMQMVLHKDGVCPNSNTIETVELKGDLL